MVNKRKKTVLWVPDAFKDRVSEWESRGIEQNDNSGGPQGDSTTDRIEKRVLPEATVMAEAAHVLRRGGLVAFPTETVYGLGASALDSQALKAVFAAKNRPADNPLIAHLSSLDQLKQLSNEVSELALRLMERFWPGSLSILLKALPELPKELTAGLDHVAVRMPRHPLTLKLIAACGFPLAGPSANVSGRPSPTTAVHVLQDLAGRIDGVLDGGSCEVGIESTVIEIEQGRIVILRPGSVSRADLAQFGVPVTYDPHLESQNAPTAPRSPGQKYRHYAPKGALTIVSAEERSAECTYIEDAVVGARALGRKVGVLSMTEGFHPSADLVRFLGAQSDPRAIGRNLYRMLRECDEVGIELIFVQGLPDTDETRAVINRLYKAAGGNFVRL